MQIEEGYRMNAEADNFFLVSDPDCVPLENSVLYILTSKPDCSCRNCNKGSCIAYCIGTIGRKLNVIFFPNCPDNPNLHFSYPDVGFLSDLLMTLLERTQKSKL